MTVLQPDTDKPVEAGETGHAAKSVLRAPMDWSTYKQLCDRPACCSRWMLEQSASLLEARAASDLAAPLRAALLQPSLVKPPDHRGPAATDMFELAVDVAVVGAICVQIDAAIAAGAQASFPGSRAAGRSLSGFSAAWRELLRSFSVCVQPVPEPGPLAEQATDGHGPSLPFKAS